MNNIFKVLRGNNCQSRAMYTANLSHKSEGKNENILKCYELKYKIKETRPSVCQKAGSEEYDTLIIAITYALHSQSANIIYTLLSSEPSF